MDSGEYPREYIVAYDKPSGDRGNRIFSAPNPIKSECCTVEKEIKLAQNQHQKSEYNSARQTIEKTKIKLGTPWGTLCYPC